jgi:hypothetical protein
MAAVHCYYCSPINKPLRAHIAMLPKFPAKIFRATVIWHMTSLAHCYCDLIHMSVTQHSLRSNKFDLIVENRKQHVLYNNWKCNFVFVNILVR